MKRTRIILKVISLLSVAVLISSCFSSCSANSTTQQQETSSTQESTSETTTEETTVTTTEDTETTFAEVATRKVYDGLSKDKDGSYPYKLASYSTVYNASNETRTTNLKVAIGKINNIKIPSGKVFSFNQTVGKRTVTAGYESATVVANGEFVDGLGGGVCQVSSTIFECVLRANLDIVERTCHSLEIGYVPLGGDATVQWNSKDFQFKNNYDCNLRLKLTCSNGKLVCEIWADKDITVGTVKLNITESNGVYTLTRTVDGKQNYKTTSQYKKSSD